MRIAASRALPLGFWANGAIILSPDEDGPPRLSGEIGHLPVPRFIAEPLISLARWALSTAEAPIPAPDAVIRTLTVSTAGLSADVMLPGNAKLMQALQANPAAPIAAAEVRRHYCRLSALDHKAPTPDFAVQINRTFAGPTDDGRARLVALAMQTVSVDVGRLVGDPAAITKGCAALRQAPILLDRTDLPKHWALSAALTAALGSEASYAMGIWKEVSDSGPKGSGFSYVDLAADRSGILVARRLSDGRSRAIIHPWLERVTHDRLLPVTALALQEGMSEADFKARFGGIDAAQNAAMVARIDAALAAGLP